MSLIIPEAIGCQAIVKRKCLIVEGILGVQLVGREQLRLV